MRAQDRGAERRKQIQMSWTSMPAFIPPRLGQQDHHVGGAQQLYTPNRHVFMERQNQCSEDERKSLGASLVLVTSPKHLPLGLHGETKEWAPLRRTAFEHGASRSNDGADMGWLA
jgi:hypothetical protein